jgi:hypothetical protein
VFTFAGECRVRLANSASNASPMMTSRLIRMGVDPGLYIALEKWLRDFVTLQRDTEGGALLA